MTAGSGASGISSETTFVSIAITRNLPLLIRRQQSGAGG